MPASSNPQDSTDSLTSAVTSTLSLVHQFLAELSPTAATTLLPNEHGRTEPLNPLNILNTSAVILKAQTTKLALLLINEPFTTSAITSIISEVASTCIPAMMAAVQICQPDIYSQVLHNEVKAQVRRVFSELEKMLEEVLVQSSSHACENGRIVGSGSSRDQLASTGVVWEACDSLIQLNDTALVGLVAKKANQYREHLEDAIKELREWSQDAETEEEEDGFEFGGGSDGESIEDMFSAANRLPRDRADVKATLELSLKHLKMVAILYQALIKRRIKTFPATTSLVVADKDTRARLKILDQLLEILKEIPEGADELATMLYELNNEEARECLQRICMTGREAIMLTRTDWTGVEDEFTIWAGKWLENIVKT